MKPYPRLVGLDRNFVIARLGREQNWLCAHCGQQVIGVRTVELAHRIRKARVRVLLGDEYMWDPRVLALVCTRKGHNCNDGVMLGQGTKAELELAEQIRKEDER